ncbi:MAG: L-fucose/L-arabinose isomerase family protein [Prolixibacteraceae bacterium]|nr:L-fucose/L-arabinose isomerase family protein [Prolixibacteraceae bacterium]MBT6764571.1 L-fucose/L-arabinose isomerase family protein [Prolixibacteraceae bacterium]MBT6998661.1 L-fucose/L-arabinose isomerase family protein [Prolixibacteraceae bacterium]MBT7397462.1 L-fucose/L-arabinose isomerase family protein [Prolixibacteraceae bacterium]
MAGKREPVKIGLFGIGLETYWDQFEGLFEKLKSYQTIISEKIKSFGVELIDAGMVDNPEKAQKAANFLKTQDVEILFLYVSTYALSSTVLPIAQKLKVPIIILNLQPVAQLDYNKFNALNDRGIKTGIWLEHCQACSVPEIANVFIRSGINYEIVTGFLNDKEAWEEIKCWTDAAKVAHAIRNNRMGILGHYYGGMLDVYTDLTKLSSTFGTHFEILEMCELKKLRDLVSEKEIETKISEFNSVFEIVPDCVENEIIRAAQTSVALDYLVKNHNLGSLAYYYEGESGNDYENIVTSTIAGNTLLTGKNIPVAGECEVKNAQAMKIMAEFGAGGSFSEFYLMDFKDDIIYLGHDGPAHFEIAEGKVKLVPLPIYHGKPGKGLSIQMRVKKGPVTLLSVVEKKMGVSLLVAEGESVPGPVLEIGNTNSRYKFSLNVKEFINEWSKQGPAHHCAIGIGHIANKIEKLGKILEIDVTKIC